MACDDNELQYVEMPEGYGEIERDLRAAMKTNTCALMDTLAREAIRHLAKCEPLKPPAPAVRTEDER